MSSHARDRAPALSPVEALARDLIVERTATRRRAAQPLRRRIRATVLQRKP